MTDSKKFTPITLACASANQASQSARAPTSKRIARGTSGQPATPRCNSHAPPSTQAAPTQLQSHGSARFNNPNCQANRPAIKQSTPISQDRPGPQPLSRPHSHPPAEINNKASAQKGKGEALNSAGNKTASSSMAVITRCLSIKRLSQIDPMA